MSMNNQRHLNFVLPMSKYFAARLLTVISQAIAAEPLPDFLQQEIQMWEEPNPYIGVVEEV